MLPVQKCHPKDDKFFLRIQKFTIGTTGTAIKVENQCVPKHWVRTYCQKFSL